MGSIHHANARTTIRIRKEIKTLHRQSLSWPGVVCEPKDRAEVAACGADIAQSVSRSERYAVMIITNLFASFILPLMQATRVKSCFLFSASFQL